MRRKAWAPISGAIVTAHLVGAWAPMPTGKTADAIADIGRFLVNPVAFILRELAYLGGEAFAWLVRFAFTNNLSRIGDGEWGAALTISSRWAGIFLIVSVGICALEIIAGMISHDSWRIFKGFICAIFSWPLTAASLVIFIQLTNISFSLATRIINSVALSDGMAQGSELGDALGKATMYIGDPLGTALIEGKGGPVGMIAGALIPYTQVGSITTWVGPLLVGVVIAIVGVIAAFGLTCIMAGVTFAQLALAAFAPAALMLIGFKPTRAVSKKWIQAAFAVWLVKPIMAGIIALGSRLLTEADGPFNGIFALVAVMVCCCSPMIAMKFVSFTGAELSGAMAAHTGARLGKMASKGASDLAGSGGDLLSKKIGGNDNPGGAGANSGQKAGAAAGGKLGETLGGGLGGPLGAFAGKKIGETLGGKLGNMTGGAVDNATQAVADGASAGADAGNPGDTPATDPGDLGSGGDSTPFDSATGGLGDSGSGDPLNSNPANPGSGNLGGSESTDSAADAGTGGGKSSSLGAKAAKWALGGTPIPNPGGSLGAKALHKAADHASKNPNGRLAAGFKAADNLAQQMGKPFGGAIAPGSITPNNLKTATESAITKGSLKGAAESAGSIAGWTQGKIDKAADSVERFAGTEHDGFKQNAAKTVNTVKKTAGWFAEDVGDAWSNAGTQFKDTGKTMKDSFSDARKSRRESSFNDVFGGQ